MIHHLNDDTTICIISFLTCNDIYAIKEINIYFCNLVKYMIRYHENTFVNFSLLSQPDINYICNSPILFQWAINHPYFYEDRLPVILAKNKQINALIYILSKGHKFNPDVYYEASKNGCSEIIKWCYKNNYEPDERAIQGACESGNLQFLKWMDKNFFPFDENACHMAAYHDKLDILKFLINKGYPWNKKIYKYASMKGNLRILKYLKKTAECDLSMPWWDKETTITAAENNQFKTLKWLRENSCPWNVNVIYAGLQCGNIEMVDWCIRNGCELDDIIKNNIIPELNI